FHVTGVQTCALPIWHEDEVVHGGDAELPPCEVEGFHGSLPERRQAVRKVCPRSLTASGDHGPLLGGGTSSSCPPAGPEESAVPYWARHSPAPYRVGEPPGVETAEHRPREGTRPQCSPLGIAALPRRSCATVRA